MTDLFDAAGAAPAAASTHSGRELRLPAWSGHLDSERAERDRLIAQARSTDAARQLQRCFPRWAAAFEHLSPRALVGLARNEPVDPNDRDLGARPTRTRGRCCAATGSRSTRAT